ncbi:actin-binding FH2, partial [Yamadazyma tenuis ATCC 10573]
MEPENSPNPKSLIPSLKPKNKLKQMHWDKIDDIDNTFWGDIEHEKLSGQLKERGILEEVERHFAVKSTQIKLRKDLSGGKTSTDQPKKISLLTRDLAQQFGINLHMFAAAPVEDLIMKVLHCDKDILDNVTVLEFFNSELLSEFNETTIRNFKPYSWEVSDPESKPKKDPAELERPDRVYLELCFNLRHYWKSRSRALLLMHSYGRDYMDLLKKLRMVDEANASIRNSDSLRHVLGIIRSVGNFMNDDSKQALGFKIGTLQRLKFMKDDTNAMHFLHYVERIIRNTFPEYGSFVDELSVLLHVQNLSIEQIETESQEFDRQINGVAESISKGNLSDPECLHPEDYVLKKVASPLESAKIKNSLLQSHVKTTMEEYNSLMTYFGENVKDSFSRNTFYEKISMFVSEFKKAHIENVQKEEEQ